MGEMSVRSRPRKDLAASFNKMRRMVSNAKCARKSMPAHQSFVGELVSVSLLPAVPSSKNSPYRLQVEDSQEVDDRSVPLQTLVPCSSSPSRIPRPWSFSCNLQLDDPLQLDDLEEMGITSSISRSSIPSSELHSANPTLSSFRLLATTSLPSSVGSGYVQTSCTSNTLKEINSLSNKISMSPRHSIAADGSKLASQTAFWAFLLSVFLCLFLYIGKEAAVGIIITAYFILWLTLKGRSFVKQILRCSSLYHSIESFVQDNQNRHLSRRWTTPLRDNAMLLSSSESHFCTRSQSLPTIHGCAQEVYTSEPPSVASLSNAAIHSAKLKLGIMLVLALCGLAHGHISAVCMCSCCLLVYSKVQSYTSKRRIKEIQNKIQPSRFDSAHSAL